MHELIRRSVHIGRGELPTVTHRDALEVGNVAPFMRQRLLTRNRAVATALAMAILLVVTVCAIEAQGPRITLVDLPIPAYPPIADSAGVSGDVSVTVEVRPDGAVASTAIVPVENAPSWMTLLAAPALEAARKARFHCEGVDRSMSYTLVFAFRFAERIGRAKGQMAPEITTIGPLQSRILIVTEQRIAGEAPTRTRGRAREARCLWLWHCEHLVREQETGEPELVLWSFTVPAYPAAARASMASADVEVTVAVSGKGRVVSAEVSATRDRENSTPELRRLFQAAALGVAREATFICKRCDRGRLSYSIVYEFRADGVLTDLDRGYRAGDPPASPTRGTVVVRADVPVLNASLNIPADALPQTCRLAAEVPGDAGPALPTNPWNGDDREFTSRVRGRITSHSEPSSVSRYELQLAEGVGQAYVAHYMGDDDTPVAVYGLFFGDSDDAKDFVELATATGAHAFVIHRQIVVALREHTPCAAAMIGLLKSRAERP